MARVSVILLNFNGGDLTGQAIDSLLKQVDVEPEIIVVDNGSTDGSREKIAGCYGERIRMINNQENQGFSPACNQGFEIATGDWVALMNNDAEADPLWLKRSLARVGGDEKIGVVIPKILNYFNREKLDGIGVGFWLDGISRARHRGELDSRLWDSDSPQVASGCACLFSKKMIDELHGFDASFFAYSEDTDLGIRIFLSGWKTVFEPKAVVYHMYSATSSGKTGYSPMKLYYVERNRIRILLRYYPLQLILVSPFSSLIRYLALASQVLFSRSKGKGLGPGAAALALSRAVLHALASLPAQMEIRKQWLSSPQRKQAMSGLLRNNRIALSEISRLD